MFLQQFVHAIASYLFSPSCYAVFVMLTITACLSEQSKHNKKRLRNISCKVSLTVQASAPGLCHDVDAKLCTIAHQLLPFLLGYHAIWKKSTARQPSCQPTPSEPLPGGNKILWPPSAHHGSPSLLFFRDQELPNDQHSAKLTTGGRWQ